MKHARSDYNRIQDPEGKIPADEPVFLIRAQDMVSAAAVRAWADLAEQNDADAGIVAAARTHADRMDRWQRKYGRKVADMPKYA